ncbi:LEA2 domain-containing protein [Phanerochaete sordida]|uniref:LEA2 domain-containing protein n=1 Tax=Phanerochaete sordida TaxID=48140 RepID=A0A9P3GHK9_9APHY|nr:LEA2 domain-containing protein [Phanerochaete sordida]
MSYDQYRGRNDTYPPPQQFYGADQADGAFNPYDNAAPHRSYEQGGYQDAEYRDEPIAPPPPVTEKETNAYATTRDVPAGRSPRAMKRWRHEHQGNLWTAGGGLRCCGRFFCCTLLIFVFLLISIVLSLVLWIEPPNVEIGDVTPVTNGSAFQLQSDGIAVNLQVPISVNNPNYFSVKFDTIDADIFYPTSTNNTDIGGGVLRGLNIASKAQTNFTLPFTLNYTFAIDPNYNILRDIATKCGFLGSGASQLKVNYEIHLDFKVLFIPIKPTIKNSASFTCPITEDEVAGLLKQAGIDLGSLNLSSLLKSLKL